MAWSSIVPKSYKCRTTIGHFHWSKQVSMNFAGEDKHIKTKFLKADYPLRFADSIKNNTNSIIRNIITYYF